MIDTLTIARELDATGMPAGQARAIAAAIGQALRDEELATKPFVRGVADELRREMADLRAELKREMNGLAWKMAGLLLAHAASAVAVAAGAGVKESGILASHSNSGGNLDFSRIHQNCSVSDEFAFPT